MAAPGRPATADATGDRVWDATSADPRVAMQAAHKTCRLRLGRLLCSPRFVRRVAVARRAMPLSAGSPAPRGRRIDDCTTRLVRDGRWSRPAFGGRPPRGWLPGTAAAGPRDGPPGRAGGLARRP